MEKHPHLHLFDARKKWRYLIIGTFPPNPSLREKLYINYFYGNKGFLWKIIHDLYCNQGYDFFGGTSEENLKEIIRWQEDYGVGLSDTIVSCSRKDPMSSNDSDLIDIQYNYPLRNYVLQNRTHIKKIIFTSTLGKRSAFETFRVIMQTDLDKIADKLVTGLPSPSGSANITFFNGNREETLGLTDDFYFFVLHQHPEFIPDFRKRWEQKKRKRMAGSTDRKKMLIDPSPKGLVKEYKLWRYRQVLPEKSCV